jgi:hypothetical protein
LYKIYARDFGLKGAEVVAEYTLFPGSEMIVHEMVMTMEEIIVDPIVVEVSSQEEC